jgi:hypothetical protein
MRPKATVGAEQSPIAEGPAPQTPKPSQPAPPPPANVPEIRETPQPKKK